MPSLVIGLSHPEAGDRLDERDESISFISFVSLSNFSLFTPYGVFYAESLPTFPLVFCWGSVYPPRTHVGSDRTMSLTNFPILNSLSRLNRMMPADRALFHSGILDLIF